VMKEKVTGKMEEFDRVSKEVQGEEAEMQIRRYER